MEQNYHTFRLGTINVRTCKRLAHDITCMQEVRQRGEGEICFNDDVLRGWRLVYNGMTVAQAGVAVALAPHVILIDVQHIVEG